jgi:cytochrome b subunit of formate dehydrogenase
MPGMRTRINIAKQRLMSFEPVYNIVRIGSRVDGVTYRPIYLFFISLVTLIFPSTIVAQSRAECLNCHSDSSMTMERNGRQISIYVNEAQLNKSPHKKLVCVACHAGFDAGNVPHKERIESVKCQTCHKDARLKHPFHPEMIQAGGKPGTPDFMCKDCHGTHDIVSPKVPHSKFSSENIVDACGECHGDVKDTFLHSEHFKALNAGVKGAPNCIACHQNAITRVLAGQDTAQLKVEQEKVCLSCHLDDPNVRARTSPTAGFIAAFQSSVHGAALSRGNGEAANCIDCHGSHEMNKGSNPESRVSRMNIPTTCSKCHERVAVEYKQSVHGIAAGKGVTDAPVCTDCHGEHNILMHNDPKSPVAAANLSSQVCSPCHSSVRLTAKYGISSDRFQTFSASFHGLANKAGNIEVANCASCHGSHNIKPSSDPTSSVNKANLVATCGKCHPGANERFTMGSVHLTMTSKEEPVLYWIATSYVLLIIIVIGGMIVHNALDFIKKSKRKLLVRRGIIIQEHVGHRLYLRMSLSERIQHATLFLSFGTLVLTGFALKFPDAWWVAPIRSISPMMFDLRGIVHRVAAATMVLASLYHTYYILFDPRGKQLFRDLLPKLDDITDAIGVLKYNLGFSPTKPKFGRFSYVEKSEYWALVWGTIVMTMTGIILWFDNTFLGILTKLWWDVARTIHYYEAWLATLAIIVWHFYFVIFNPDTYPISLAFWKGTLTEEEMSEEHPRELDEIKRQEILEELRQTAPPKKATE